MNPLIGTCSWNYDSWLGLVYTGECGTAAEYLKEYSLHYRTAEIDSWFYRIPTRGDVFSYLSSVDSGFRFTCKVTNGITLTHKRGPRASRESVPNADFLSTALFGEYLEAIEPMMPHIDAVMLEFEYLNREKMPSLGRFIRVLEEFVRSVPEGVPLAIETRNKNYLHEEYFAFLKENGVMHVFSEKLYMPPVYEVYETFGDKLAPASSVIRLLGGDRKEIEEKTGGRWNRIAEPKADLAAVAGMVKDMISRGMLVTVNVNNHYEGSAPLTIRRLRELLSR